GYDWPNYPYGINGEVNSNTRRRMTDNLTGNTAGGAAGDQNNRLRHQFDWTATLFKDNLIRGNHALKFGMVSEWETQEFTDYGFLDRPTLTVNSPVGSPDFTTPFRVTLRNTDRLEINSSWHHGAFLTDQWQISSRVTAN